MELSSHIEQLVRLRMSISNIIRATQSPSITARLQSVIAEFDIIVQKLSECEDIDYDQTPNSSTGAPILKSSCCVYKSISDGS